MPVQLSSEEKLSETAVKNWKSSFMTTLAILTVQQVTGHVQINSMFSIYVEYLTIRVLPLCIWQLLIYNFSGGYRILKKGVAMKHNPNPLPNCYTEAAVGQKLMKARPEVVLHAVLF